MAEIFNRNFASVYTTENIDSLPESPAPPQETTPLQTGTILQQDTQRYVDKLDKLVNFFEDNHMMTDAQHGFRNKPLCLNNLLDFLQCVYEYWEISIPSDMTYSGNIR